jgi:transcriptional/translational regulatory protein YebC/TACO1
VEDDRRGRDIETVGNLLVDEALDAECQNVLLAVGEKRRIILVDVVLDAGADDLVVEDGEAEIWADPEFFEPLTNALNEKGIPTEIAEVTRKPEMEVNITDPKVAAQVLRLVDRMEEIDDVQNVTANYVIDDSIADQIEE